MNWTLAVRRDRSAAGATGDCYLVHRRSPDPEATMSTLPAVPDTAAGEVTGRIEMLHGELVVRLRLARVRDVTATPVDQESVHRHYRGCECRLFGTLRYVGPVTPELQAETERLDAYWTDPPLWSPLRWIPDQRRLRALEKRERALLAAAKLELEMKEKEVAT